MLNKEQIIYGPLQNLFEGPFSKLKCESEWKQQRKVNMSKLSKKYLDCYNEVFFKRSQELIKKLTTKTGEFDVHPWIMLMALDIVLETHCNIKRQILIEENVQIYEAIQEISADFQRKVFTLTLLKTDLTFIKKMKNFYSFTKEIINEVLTRYHNPDTEFDFQPLCNKYIETKPSHAPLNEYILKAILEMVAEGQFTIGTSISCALLNLAIHTEYQEKVWEEQKEIFGDSLHAPRNEDLAKMNYLERVMKESFRVSSPPSIFRRSSGRIETAGGVIIPNNASVIFAWDTLRKDKRYWKNAERFDPDHFLPEEVEKRPKGAYFAFSAGPRSCPGFPYAMNCSKVVISNVIRQFRMTSSLKPEDLSYVPAFMTEIGVPSKVYFEPRKSLKNI